MLSQLLSIFVFQHNNYSALGPHGGTGGSPWCDEARSQVTGVEVGAGITWTICDHDHYHDHDHCRHPRHDQSS